MNYIELIERLRDIFDENEFGFDVTWCTPLEYNTIIQICLVKRKQKDVVFLEISPYGERGHWDIIKTFPSEAIDLLYDFISFDTESWFENTTLKSINTTQKMYTVVLINLVNGKLVQNTLGKYKTFDEAYSARENFNRIKADNMHLFISDEKF